MPFKNVTSPRQVNTLDAEIRGLAYLAANPELVAVVTSSPVRLAIQPIGSNGRITNLTLNQGDEIALLAKDVALVRSGDAVWAALNIAHTPKVHQIASDIRQLAARPSGGSTLALGWDGSATEITLNKNDVDARNFQLRGDVRAIDMTATDTYVVVDKSDSGGELRVHPGGTPESGANWRATLPKEAAKLDRLRASAKISAIYKRGKSEVCVVTASGGRLTAKMVRLAEVPTDIAVIETSMCAIFPGGRAAVYNAEKLAGADDGPLDPTASVSFPARGEPRAVIAVGKGAPLLWIGTSAGDIVTVALARQASLSDV